MSNLADLIKIRNSKILLGPISYLKSTVKFINNSLPEKGVPELRWWVKFLKNLHPKVNEYIYAEDNKEEFKVFQPIPEYLGHLLNYVHDTQSLPTADWANNWVKDPNQEVGPHALRITLRQKMNLENANMVDETYIKLNEKMQGALSREFTQDNGNPRPGINVAHSYHISGDRTFYDNFVLPSATAMKKKLNDALGYAVKMLNHEFGVVANEKITNEPFDRTVEGKTIPVDSRGNKLTPVITEYDKFVENNDSYIKPVGD